MNIEDQVLTIEQAKHLQSLGLDMSDAAFCWLPLKEETLFIPVKYIYKDDEDKKILTYTLQEVLDKLPAKIELVDKDEDVHEVFMRFNNHILWYDENLVLGGLRPFVSSYFKSPIVVAYEALCWVIENGYLKEDNK